MKIRHKVPSVASEYHCDPISDAYQSRVDYVTRRNENREREAQRKLEAAQMRLDRLSRTRPKSQLLEARARESRALLVARETVELRRQELLTIQRSMNGVPASSAHRTRASRRAVPGMHTL